MGTQYPLNQLIWLAKRLAQDLDTFGQTRRAFIIGEFNNKFSKAQPLTIGRLSRIYLDNGKSVQEFVRRYKDRVPESDTKASRPAPPPAPKAASLPKKSPPKPPRAAKEVSAEVLPALPESPHPAPVTPQPPESAQEEELPKPVLAPMVPRPKSLSAKQAMDAELGGIIVQGYLDWDPYHASFASAHALAAKMVNERLGEALGKRYSANDIEVVVKKAGGVVEFLMDSGIEFAQARLAAERAKEPKYKR
jgi:hypothetical protein